MSKPKRLLPYSRILAALRGPEGWEGFGEVYRELCGKPVIWTQEGAGKAFAEVMSLIDRDYFPLYLWEDHAWELEHGHRLLDEGCPDLGGFVIVEGLDQEREWEDWNPPVQLVMATLYRDDTYPAEARKWWTKLRVKYDLPPLDEVDAGEAVARLQDLPEPWDGLQAIYNWLGADTGNFFVDISPLEMAECGCGVELAWDMLDINATRDHYREARRLVFDPADRLNDLLDKSPGAFETCLDLILGRVNANELIILEELPQ